jgi:hypothetical protein
MGNTESPAPSSDSQESEAFIRPASPSVVTKAPRKYDWIVENWFGKPGPAKAAPTVEQIIVGRPRNNNPLVGTDMPSLTSHPRNNNNNNNKNKETAVMNGEIDYAVMLSLMERLSEKKDAKRSKALVFRKQASNLVKARQSSRGHHEAAIVANLKRAVKLEEEANTIETQYLALDSQIELLNDVQLTGDTLKLFIHSTELIEQELRKFSEADVSRILDDLEDTAEKAQEYMDDVSVEAPGQPELNWEEIRDFVTWSNSPEAAQREADEAEENAKTEAAYAMMNTLPATPANTPTMVQTLSPLAMRQHEEKNKEEQGHRRAITVAEFEEGTQYENVLF